MVVTMVATGEEFGVWVALKPGDPIEQECSFAIGSGSTPREAFDAAKRALDQACDDLVVLAHDNGVQVQR
jgi:GTP cyclohydrolase III